MKKSIFALFFLLFTGIAFSQTTVTLQDQCNCEVLKGTAVSSPGATTPSGADTGDIYVNTNTGTIYFWDGNSWELTSSDDQQLTGFTFNDATNTLALTLENGGSVNVDLSSLSDTLTDTNTIVTSFGIDGTNTNLVITDSEGNTFSVALADLAALIDTDTTLTDAQVATAVNNEFPNLDTDSTDDFSGDFGNLTNVPANLDTDSTDDFSGDFGDLANVPANLDLDSTDDFDGQWSSLTGVPADFADNVDNVDDADNDPANELQAITSTDGTVTVTPNGNDFDLSGFSGDFGDLANVPTNLDLDSTDDFDGLWSSLTGVPAGFADNIDNDTQLTDAQVATAVNNEFPNLDTDGTDDFSGNFGDLSNVPANLDLDSTDDFDGQWSSLTGVPAGFADNIDNDTQLTDAQVATAVNNEFPNLDTDGTDDFSGNFGDLSNVPTNLDTDSTDDFSGDFNDLTNVPANLDTDSTDDFSGDFGDLANVPTNLDLDSTDDFDGLWSSLTGVPAGFADNIDNDTQLTDAQVAIAMNNEFPNLDTDSTDDFSGDFGDLANVPTNLDLDSTDDFDGQWGSLRGVPADFADNVDNVDDADSVIGNEYNTGSSISDGVLGITDGGGTQQMDLISNDANNNISFGSDGALYLNVASVSIAETITNLSDNNNGTFTYVNENGVSQTINKSAITDNLDGTYTFDNGDGSPITFIGTDNDTQLTDAQVATAVNNEFPNLDTDGTDDFSGNFGDLSNVPANLDTDSTDDFSGDFGDLTNVPTNLDLDSTDDFDGQWSSLSGVPADFADNVDNVDDADNDPANELQAITSTDGTVTVTPNGNDFDLSGFSGDFGDLSNVPANLDTDSTDDFSGDFGDLANVPTNLDLDSTDDFDGQWSSLTGVPAGFADNIDNDTQLTDAQVATAMNNEFPNLDTDSTDDFSGDFGDLANVPANLDTDSTDDFSGDFGDLTNVPTNLDLDSTDDFDGQWSSLTGVPADFADNVDNVDDADNDPANELQAITSTDGTVTVTPNGNDFDLSGFSGDFGDLSNVPANLDTDSTDDFSGDFGDLTNVPANLDTDSTDDFSGDFGDLTNVPTNLDLDSTDDFDGQWSSLSGVPADFADNVDNVDDADNDPANELQAITSTDGTVTVTPNGNDFDLSGFSGDFGDLSNVPTNLDTDSTDDFSGDFGDLANVPTNLDLDSTDDFDGLWSSLTGVPAGFADNIDNDTQLTDAQVATAMNNEFPNLDTDSTDDFSGDFGDLVNVPTNLDLDSTDDFDGQWSSLSGVPADFADNVDNVDDADNDPANELQAITSTDGTVTVTPNGNDFDLSGFSGDFGDLSNVPTNLDTDSTDDFSGDFGDLTNVPANLDTDSTDDFSGDFGDLANVPTNLDLDSTDDFDGQWSSLTGVPADFADNVDNVDDADNDPANELQAITSTDGTVTVTPNGNDFDLSGFSGDFGDLSNVPANLDTDSTDDFSGDFGDLANVPTNLDLDSTDDFDGQWSSLTGVPADFADNVDNVDDADASVTNEINTRFEVNGTNLEIEDSNGTLQVPLANINTDDQNASEVDSDNPVDVDGDGTAEDTVEEVIQAIAPITAKAARIFYPPSIAIDASTNGIGRTVNLYAQYVAQYGTPAVSSAGAPAAIPTYGATDLYYYVTYADPTVFANMSINASGVLTYDIIGQPADYNALINVVFVVK